MSSEVLLTVEDAAARLKISKHTLNRWRVTGEGPPFVKYGPRLVRYREVVLDAWALDRTRGSTSEYGREIGLRPFHALGARYVSHREGDPEF